MPLRRQRGWSRRGRGRDDSRWYESQVVTAIRRTAIIITSRRTSERRRKSLLGVWLGGHNRHLISLVFLKKCFMYIPVSLGWGNDAAQVDVISSGNYILQGKPQNWQFACFSVRNCNKHQRCCTRNQADWLCRFCTYGSVSCWGLWRHFSATLQPPIVHLCFLSSSG